MCPSLAIVFHLSSSIKTSREISLHLPSPVLNFHLLPIPLQPGFHHSSLEAYWGPPCHSIQWIHFDPFLVDIFLLAFAFFHLFETPTCWVNCSGFHPTFLVILTILYRFLFLYRSTKRLAFLKESAYSLHSSWLTSISWIQVAICTPSFELSPYLDVYTFLYFSISLWISHSPSAYLG